MAEKKKGAAGARRGKRPAGARPGADRQQNEESTEVFGSESGAQTDPPPGGGGG